VKGNVDIPKLVEICRLYYDDRLTQAQIAKKLDISRPTVSKLIAEAREKGIVKIEIKSPLEGNSSLLEQLIGTFKLQGGLIVPTSSNDENLNVKLTLSQGAVYLEGLLDTMKNVGLGWGYSMGGLIDALNPQAPKENIDRAVCPIIGSAANAIRWYQTNELTRIFAEKTGFKPYFLHAPAFPLSGDNKKHFENTFEFQEISNLWTELDTVILSIGTYPSVPDQATAARFGNKLRERKAIGMITAYYFDIEGNIIESENDIVIRLPLEILRKVKRVIAISGGEKKISSTHGALMTGMVTHLITDEITAQRIMKIQA
jgi:DNA-binding transcriptional regulator LsrR (DeoR family)